MTMIRHAVTRSSARTQVMLPVRPAVLSLRRPVQPVLTAGYALLNLFGPVDKRLPALLPVQPGGPWQAQVYGFCVPLV